MSKSDAAGLAKGRGRAASAAKTQRGRPSKVAKKSKRDPHRMEVNVPKGERLGPEVARKLMGPVNRHAVVAGTLAGANAAFKKEDDRPTIKDWAMEMRARLDKAEAGDLSLASEMLSAQAITLDTLFTEMVRRAANNVDAGYMQAFEIYMRHAFKAQAGSRQSLEALARLHQPREQTVRHVHVNEGGQAILAGQFHHHTGGPQNGEAVIQSHGPSASAAPGAPLLCQDAAGNGVPVPGHERPEPVSTPRGKGRRSARKPQRMEARRPIGGYSTSD